MLRLDYSQWKRITQPINILHYLPRLPMKASQSGFLQRLSRPFTYRSGATSKISTAKTEALLASLNKAHAYLCWYYSNSISFKQYQTSLLWYYNSILLLFLIASYHVLKAKNIEHHWVMLISYLSSAVSWDFCCVLIAVCIFSVAFSQLRSQWGNFGNSVTDHLLRTDREGELLVGQLTQSSLDSIRISGLLLQ